MAAPTRFKRVGFSGSKDTTSNQKDTFAQTFEFDLAVVASTTAQNSGVKVPAGIVQAVSAYIDVETAEATGTTKTVSVGVGGAGNNILNGASVAATGGVGTPVAAAINTTSANNELTFSLGSADFAELAGRVVVTLLCQSDS